MGNLVLYFADDRRSELPHPPRAHVQVKFTTGDKYITQTCMTVSEFDGEIDRLKGELDGIRIRGHAEFLAVRNRAALDK